MTRATAALLLAGSQLGLMPTISETGGGSGSDMAGETRVPSSVPYFNALSRYQNASSLTVSGVAMANDLVTLSISEPDGGYEYIAVADSDGLFSTEIGITRGVDTEIVAGNELGSSSPILTHACSTRDAFEIEPTQDSTWGDTCDPNPIHLSDDFPELSLVDITGNVLEDGDEDWFRVVAIDTTSAEESYRYEDFRFQVSFLEGQDSYTFRIFEGGCTADNEACAGEHYTEFEEIAEDIEPDELGEVPADARACGGEPYNDCIDLSETDYIVVTRSDGLFDCTHYRLRIQNGNW